jgi:hypothetical protein
VVTIFTPKKSATLAISVSSFTIATLPFLRISSRPVLEPSTINGLAGLIGHERKAGETVLESGFVRNKRHDKLSMIFGC